MSIQHIARIGVSLFALVFLCGGCSTTAPKPGVTLSKTEYGEVSSSASPKPGTTVIQQAAITFASDLYTSSTNPDVSSLAQKLLGSGRALLDLRCDEYIDSLGSANQLASHDRKQVGLIGGFMSAIMGLTSATPADISGVATSFSFAGASMDAYSTSMLFSDASKSVGKLVRDAQRAYLLDIRPQLDKLNYADAILLLTGYEQTCRPAEIRKMIDEAVAKSVIIAEVPGGADTQVISLLSELSAALGVSVNEGDAISLYAWITDVDNRADIAKGTPFLAGLLAKTNATALVSKIGSSFMPLYLIGNPIAQRWAYAVSQVPGSKGGKAAKEVEEQGKKVADAVSGAAEAKRAADTALPDKAVALNKIATDKQKIAEDEKAKLPILQAFKPMVIVPILRVK